MAIEYHASDVVQEVGGMGDVDNWVVICYLY